MKKNKTLCFEDIIIERLELERNASAYLSDLVLADIKREEAIKTAKNQNMSLDELTSKIQIEEETKAKREAENLARRRAWDSLEFEVREAIRAEEGWGELWKNQIYNLYLEKGNLDMHTLNSFLVNREMEKKKGASQC